MDINSFVSKFHTHPVLFIGTGMSIRYLEESFTWRGLLERVMTDLDGNDEEFYNIHSHCKGNYPLMASEIERIFNKILEKDRNGKFKFVNDAFFEAIRNGADYSRFKIYLNTLLSGGKLKPEMAEEIKVLKTIRKNISSIITTNYDNLIEDIFQFEPLVGNNILLSNPYGSVYKIHGTIGDPSSIIITQEDYQKFETKYELIRAQLLSLFIHNPIIFIGYSLTDDNIKNLLHTIFSYVEPDSEQAEKIRDNFLVVERDEGNENIEVLQYDIIIDNKSIKINKIKTDNFIEIYRSLSNLRLPISAMDIRKVQDIVGDIYKGTDGIKVEITEDLDSLKNSDKVIVIGSNKTIRYQYQTAKELMNNYFSVIEESDEQRLSLIDKYQINSNQYFPIFGFSKINSEIHNEKTLKEYQINKISSIKNNLSSFNKLNCSHHSIRDILDDESIKPSYKNDSIIYSVLIKKDISIDDLEKYLKDYSDSKSTDYNKLLVVYDFLKYGDE